MIRTAYYAYIGVPQIELSTITHKIGIVLLMPNKPPVIKMSAKFDWKDLDDLLLQISKCKTEDELNKLILDEKAILTGPLKIRNLEAILFNEFSEDEHSIFDKLVHLA